MKITSENVALYILEVLFVSLERAVSLLKHYKKNLTIVE